MKTKALVLYSGGLDSRLVVKLLQDQNLDLEAIYFNLPFGCGCCDLSCNFKFTQLNNLKLKIFDCTKSPLLEEYLEIVKQGKFGRGKGFNPCKDCKLFMFKKAKAYADAHKIKIIATGEVLGERPMSQTHTAMKIIDKELGFEILRPLSALLLPETSWEKQGLVDRKKFLDINGRKRERQIALAKKYKITFPNPAGGCLLCHAPLKNKFEILFNNALIAEKTLPLIGLARHFFIKGNWFVVGKNEQENSIIESYENSIKSSKGNPAVYYSPPNKDNKLTANNLQKAYHLKEKEKFEKFKL